ncbi:hypothetical protein Pelo_1230 [Pelomyxa schiedti]|nr:hypothetical protein Pelo_1230 [Pelomyxa schiedti]
MVRLVGVCGPTCSGKSTVSTRLAAALTSAATRARASQAVGGVPGVGADGVLRQDTFFDHARVRGGRGTAQPSPEYPQCVEWFLWDHESSLDWPAFLAALRMLKSLGDDKEWAVVDGFILLERPECYSLLDAVCYINVDEVAQWQRRLSRAQWLHEIDPLGTGSDANGDKNYELIEIYTPADHITHAKAQSQLAFPHDDPTFAWLHLYFVQLVIPQARLQVLRAKEMHSRHLAAATASRGCDGIPAITLEMSDNSVPKEDTTEKITSNTLAFLATL